MTIPMSPHTSAQLTPDAEQGLAVWQWEGGALASPPVPQAAVSTGGYWCIVLTLLGDIPILREAAQQSDYAWDQGYWTRIFMRPLRINGDPHGARLLQEWAQREARRFEVGYQISEPRLISTDWES